MRTVRTDKSRHPVVVCFPFIGDEIGGSHISCVKLIEALDPAKVTALVVLHTLDGRLAPYLSAHGISFVQSPTSSFPARSAASRSPLAILGMGSYVLGATGGLRRLLLDNQVDVVHTNDGRIHMVWALAARLAGARHVWHHRGDPDAIGVNLLAPLVAAHLVTVSNFARPNRPLIGVDHKLSVVHSPFDQPEQPDRVAARNMLIDAIQCPPDTRFVGYFGLLIDRKRPVAFVEVVAAYLRRHPDMPLMGLIFGSPGKELPDYDQVVLHRAQQLGIAAQIRLMGFRQPIEPWMAAIDATIVTAVREPFGRTLVEAMFLGTPVIATDDGGNREAIEHGVDGYLVPADQPDAFVDPLHTILTDAGKARMIAENARNRASTRFGIQKHVEALTRIYATVTDPAHRGETAAIRT